MADNHLLDEQVILQVGPFQRVRRWWKGARTDKGTIIWGWTGLETVEEIDRIIPKHTVRVEDSSRKAA
jgi:hypothetical protein